MALGLMTVWSSARGSGNARVSVVDRRAWVLVESYLVTIACRLSGSHR